MMKADHRNPQSAFIHVVIELLHHKMCKVVTGKVTVQVWKI